MSKWEQNSPNLEKINKIIKNLKKSKAKIPIAKSKL